MELSSIPAAENLPALYRALRSAADAGCPRWAVAKSAGISPTMLTQMSKGVETGSADTRRRVAEALGQPVGVIFPGI